MTTVRSFRIATAAAIILAALAAGAGLFWTPVNDVPLDAGFFGAGLYRRDTPFVAGGSQGSDLLSLFFFVPVVAWLALSGRTTRLSYVFLATAHSWWLYLALSLAFGAVAFNELFPVYVAMLPVCVIGVALALSRLDPVQPPRFLALFLFFSGMVTLLAWTMLLWVELSTGQFPPLTYYTVRTTFAIDLGLIVPGCFATGLAVWKGWTWWPVLAVPLLGIEATLLPMMALQTMMQLRAGVVFGPEAAAPFLGFGLISPAALWFLWRMARDTSPLPDRS